MATKQLARELGLLRKRSLSVASPQQMRKRQRIGQTFSYLIVVDFESTCWDKDRSSPQEIIEFPAVLLNTRTGQIESEFRYFVQPTERPTLSDFCRRLTGISQVQVDDGIPLSLCLKKFSGWLKKLHDDNGIVCSGNSTARPGTVQVNLEDNEQNAGLESTTTVGQKTMQTDRSQYAASSTSQGGVAALVTWSARLPSFVLSPSDWDLGVCLLYETRRKQIPRPPSLTEWIDLRATYKAFYGRKPDGLKGALMDLGIMFDGREHSGLDDARNTARLAWQMMCDGCVMTITKTVKMSGSGRIERLSFPPSSGPVYSSMQSHQHTNTHFHQEHKMEDCMKAGTLFDIARDDKEVKINARTEQVTREDVIHQHAKKGLSERNLNSLTTKSAGIPLTSSKLEDHPVLKHIQKTLAINSRRTLPGANCQQQKSASKVAAALKQSWVGNSWTTATCSHQKQHMQVSRLGLHHTSASTTTNNRSLRSPACEHAPGHAKPSSVITVTHLVSAVETESSTTIQAVNISLMCKTTAQTDLNTDSMCRTNNRDVSSSVSLRMSPNISSLIETLTTYSTSFKTPSTSLKTPTSVLLPCMRITPALCFCGRRSVRRLVQGQGPNTGRCFFTCTASNEQDSGCRFFQWEKV